MRSNVETERPTFVRHLECGLNGDVYKPDTPHGLSDAGKPLLVRYDLAAVAKAVSREDLRDRVPDLWRYRELLPVRRAADIVSLGETMTPLIPLHASARQRGVDHLLVKDEGRMPTGSFKSRGLCMAVSMARAFGVRTIAMPSAGNAGAALAAYAARAGMACHVFCPDDTPEITLSEIALHGARVYRVEGTISDFGPIIARGRDTIGWYDVSTFKEPYRVEGKKTMGIELAEQFGWTLPDVIFYPTGGGTGLVGMWKAFDELESIGWIGSQRPRMVAVQAETCAPIVRAFEAGERFAARIEGGDTQVPGLRVPATVADFLILDALRESGGFAIAVADGEVESARATIAESDGLHLCPEGAACFLAYCRAFDEGRVTKDERVVLFNCATGLKYPMPPVTRRFDLDAPVTLETLGLS